MDTGISWAKRLSEVSRESPLTVYSSLMMSLHQEWQFVYCATPGVVPLYEPLEASLRDGFLLVLLGTRIENATGYLCKCITWGVKGVGIGIPDPTQTSPENFDTSDHCYDVLTASMISGEELDTRKHENQVREGRNAVQERRVHRE